MPLGMEVGLGLHDIVLDGNQLPFPKGHSLQFSANALWPNGWDPATLRKKAHPHPPNFWPMSIVAKRLDGSRRHLVRR